MGVEGDVSPKSLGDVVLGEVDGIRPIPLPEVTGAGISEGRSNCE
jgi:hypothetical protein